MYICACVYVCVFSNFDLLSISMYMCLMMKCGDT